MAIKTVYKSAAPVYQVVDWGGADIATGSSGTLLTITPADNQRVVIFSMYSTGSQQQNMELRYDGVAQFAPPQWGVHTQQINHDNFYIGTSSTLRYVALTRLECPLNAEVTLVKTSGSLTSFMFAQWVIEEIVS